MCCRAEPWSVEVCSPVARAIVMVGGARFGTAHAYRREGKVDGVAAFQPLGSKAAVVAPPGGE